MDAAGSDVPRLGRVAVESALAASIAARAIRPVGVEELRTAAAVRPSVAQWMAQARDIVAVSNPGGV